MIIHLQGRLVFVGGGRAHVECGAFTYELLVPATDEPRLSMQVDEMVSFHTLHYLEAQGQGSSYIPRLIGFASPEDRDFFTLFTTVRGMGNRKALRALTMPFGAVAEAIAGKNVDILKSLPEVGKRTAETIVAELHGKVDRFIELKPLDDAGLSPEATGTRVLRQDTVNVLKQLGESPMRAQELVERALRADPQLESPDDLLAAALRLRELG